MGATPVSGKIVTERKIRGGGTRILRHVYKEAAGRPRPVLYLIRTGAVPELSLGAVYVFDRHRPRLSQYEDLLY